MLPRLCYVLPEYRSDDATHFSHIHDFLRQVSGYFNLALVVEKGSLPPPELGASTAYLLKSRFAPMRLLEALAIFLKLRLSGTRDFYVHYSFSAAFIASCIVRILGGRVYYWNCGEPWKYKRGFFRELFERAVYHVINFQVTGAPKLADEYSKHYGIPRGKIKVMPNWIDLKRFRAVKDKTAIRGRLNIPSGKKVILFVHRLSPRKGSRMIIPVAKALLKTAPESLFIVAGSGPDGAFLAEEANKDPLLKGNIMLAGSVPNKEIPDYLSVSEVLFMPSEEEGFPRVLLETMALGVPYVASDVGAVKDITPDFMKQYVVNYGDTKAFTEKLGELMSKSPAERDAVSAKLMEFVMKYDVSVVAEHFRELFS